MSNKHRNERKFYNTYFENVYKTCFFILKDENLAKDSTQETFFKAFKNIHKLEDASKEKAWITTIASRTSIDIYNKHKKRNEILDDDKIIYQQTDTSNGTNDALDNMALSKALDHLKPEQKEIMILKYIEEHSEKDIAALLGIELGTVKSRLHRAKNKLAHFMKSGGDLYEK